MTKRLALVLTVFLLPVVGLVNIALAAHRPVKPLDFTARMNPRLNGSTTSLGKTGVVVKIHNAAIAKDGTITVRATIVDSDGIPLDRLGVATKGPVSLRFIAAYIPAGQIQHVAYTTAVAKATINQNPPQTQASTDSGGTFTNNAIGDYTNTFKTKAPANFDPTVTHASASRRSAICRNSARSTNGAKPPTTYSTSFPTATGQRDALDGHHRRLQPVPQSPDRPRRIAPDGWSFVSSATLPNTTKQTTAMDAAKPVRYYFSVDQSKMTPRRQV